MKVQSIHCPQCGKTTGTVQEGYVTLNTGQRREANDRDFSLLCPEHAVPTPGLSGICILENVVKVEGVFNMIARRSA